MTQDYIVFILNFINKFQLKDINFRLYSQTHTMCKEKEFAAHLKVKNLKGRSFISILLILEILSQGRFSKGKKCNTKFHLYIRKTGATPQFSKRWYRIRELRLLALHPVVSILAIGLSFFLLFSYDILNRIYLLY